MSGHESTPGRRGAQREDAAEPEVSNRRRARGGLGLLREVAPPFLKLGLIGFGGPAAHVAMMEEEFVTRRRWVPRQHFLDLVGATNLIPGPNSTEMTMHLGYERAGARGLVTAGACFVLPAVLITGVCAWLYVTYGSLPRVEPFLGGIQPAVLAVIVGAVWKLGRKAVKGWRLGAIGAGVGAAVLAGLGEVWALLAGGLLGMLWLRAAGRSGARVARSLLPIVDLWHERPQAAIAAVGGAAAASSAVSLGGLFGFFLKVGAVLYGSGYVLVAFLEGGLVQERGWLSQAELLDAIAIGQLTPGPLLSSATFIGYLLAGVPGALVATLGIVLPSFVFVWALNPLIPRLRASAWAAAFLDSVNVASVALMAAVTLGLGTSALVTWQAWIIAALAGISSLRWNIGAPWIVLMGSGLGWALGF